MNLRLTLELLLRRHGWRAMLAMVLPVLAVVLFLLMQATQEAAPSVVLPTDGSRQLDAHHRAFLAVLIPRSELEASQRAVLDAALRHNLVAGRVDYGYEHSEAGRFGMATLQMPLRGSYSDLRGFLATVLAAQPALAVRELAIRRDAAGNGVEAQLQLAFHTAAPSEGRR
jgi:hypothetical protein